MPSVHVEPFVIGDHKRSARSFSSCIDLEVIQLSVIALKHRRNRTTAGHDEELFRRHQCALGRDARKGRCTVRLLDVLSARAVIDPLHVARLRIQSVQKRAHHGPDAGREIDRLVANDRSTASRPYGNNPSVANRFLLGRCPSEFPVQFPGLCRHTIQVAIVAGKIDLTVPTGSRKSNRTVGEVSPKFIAGLRVECGQFVTVVKPDEHPTIQHDWFKDAIVGHQVQVERIVPRLDARFQSTFPKKLQIDRQFFNGRPRPLRVRPPHGPVRSRRTATRLEDDHDKSQNNNMPNHTTCPVSCRGKTSLLNQRSNGGRRVD